MPKRKLKSGSVDETTTKQSRCNNPFLQFIDEETPTATSRSSTVEDDLLVHTVVFLELGGQHGESEQKKVLESLSFLLEFLEKSDKDGAAAPEKTEASVTRTTTILLPWVTRKLIETSSSPSQDDALLWRALVASLKDFAPSSNERSDNTHFQMKQNVLNQALTNKVLLKLVTYAAQVALSGDTSGTYATKCYEMLLHGHFIPSLDVACKTLFFPVISEIAGGKLGKGVRASSITKTTLQVLKESLKRANPKTAFQVVSTSDTLVAFSQSYFYFEDLPVKVERDQECQNLILEILWESLFHPEHHLDGFRSIVQLRGVPTLDTLIPKESSIEKETKDDDSSKQSTFQCYQENLLVSLQALLVVHDTHSLETQNLVLVARLLPLLFRGFLEKFSEYDGITKQSRTKKRGSSKLDLAQMQFFFFATAAVPLWRLARQATSEKVNAFTLESLSQCLKLLLLHDAFVPSDEQKQLTRFNLLEAITAGAIETAWSDSAAFGHATAVVETLVSLDHRLVDDKLESIVAFCAKQHVLEEDTGSPQARHLLVTLIKSYQQLRRFNRMFTAILGVASTLQHEKSKSSLAALSSLLSHSRVQQAFANAVRENPSLEVKDMFGALDKWVVEASTHTGDDSLINLALTSAVRHVGVGFLANVRVDRSTAPHVAECCRQLMKNSVSALCDEGNEKASGELGQRVKFGVTLCAWIINLQMRCAFWLGHEYIHRSETESSIPQPIRRLLVADYDVDALAGGSKASFVLTSKPVPDDVMLLASFRLRQLDYLVHEQNFGESEELSLREQYKLEAERLAKRMVDWACDSRVETSRWHHVAQVITSWVPYVEEEHLRSFLIWLYASLADANDHQDTIISIYPGARKICPTVFEKERAVALALIKDASFLEIDALSGMFVPCALSTVALLIREAADFWTDTARSTEATAESSPGNTRELALVGSNSWAPSSSDQFTALLQWDKSLQVRKKSMPERVTKLLKGAVRLVKVLNGLPTPHSSAVSVDCADSALRLESFCRRLRSTDQDVMALLQDLISVLRLAAAKALNFASQDALVLMPAREVGYTLESMKESSKHMLELIGDADNEQGRRFVFATEKLVTAVAGCNLCSTSKGAMCDALFAHLKTSFCRPGKQSEIEVIALCTHGRALLGALSWSTGQIPFKADGLSEMLSTLLDWVGTLQRSTKFPPLCFHVCLFTGAVLRFISSAFEDGIPTAVAERVERLVSSFLPFVLDENRNRKELDAAFYMISCFSLTKPPFHQRQSVIEKLLEKRCEGSWLEASICSLVRDMEGESLLAAVSEINQRVQGGSKLGLRLFQVLIQAVESEEQVQIVAGFAEAMLRKSLEAFDVTSIDEDIDQHIATASSLIIELTQDRRLLTLRERDIAVILAQTSKVMGLARQSNDISSSCFSVVACLVQRFPKQLYTCVPSLITLLQSFLRHVLYEQLDEVTVRDRSQKFTRLIELLLPHKEVYKKHVLCLLLEFVHCLEHDLSLFRKECLLPSVFYLLDMLSKYEMEQLNALMDTTARTLFRSIHQSYQKLHAYKGQ